MKIKELKQRLKLNGGVDRKINEWEIIDIHIIPKEFTQESEVDFYCFNGKEVYLLRIRKRFEKKFDIIYDKHDCDVPPYLIAEYDFKTLDNGTIETILNEFQLYIEK